MEGIQQTTWLISAKGKRPGWNDQRRGLGGLLVFRIRGYFRNAEFVNGLAQQFLLKKPEAMALINEKEITLSQLPELSGEIGPSAVSHRVGNRGPKLSGDGPRQHCLANAGRAEVSGVRKRNPAFLRASHLAPEQINGLLVPDEIPESRSGSRHTDTLIVIGHYSPSSSRACSVTIEHDPFALSRPYAAGSLTDVEDSVGRQADVADAVGSLADTDGSVGWLPDMADSGRPFGLISAREFANIHIPPTRDGTGLWAARLCHRSSAISRETPVRLWRSRYLGRYETNFPPAFACRRRRGRSRSR